MNQNTIKIAADIILIIVIIGIGIYIFINIEEFKALSSNVCKMCMEKTGSKCIIEKTAINVGSPNNFVFNFSS